METVLALILAGAVLLVLETVLPGMIAGILGCLCLLAGVVVGYMEFGLATGNWILIGVAAGVLAGACLWLKFFPGSRMARPFVSTTASGDFGVDRSRLLGQYGVAQTNLRPSGAALIAGERVDVVSEGVMIESGAPLRVVAVEGLRVVVRRE